jgi:hypothetical protein
MFGIQGARIASALMLALLLPFVLPHPASAYIDPGTGSLIWQLLLAGALTAAFLVKRYWSRIRQRLQIGSTTKGEDDEENQGE